MRIFATLRYPICARRAMLGKSFGVSDAEPLPRTRVNRGFREGPRRAPRPFACYVMLHAYYKPPPPKPPQPPPSPHKHYFLYPGWDSSAPPLGGLPPPVDVLLKEDHHGVFTCCRPLPLLRDDRQRSLRRRSSERVVVDPCRARSYSTLLRNLRRCPARPRLLRGWRHSRSRRLLPEASP